MEKSSFILGINNSWNKTQNMVGAQSLESLKPPKINFHKKYVLTCIKFLWKAILELTQIPESFVSPL